MTEQPTTVEQQLSEFGTFQQKSPVDIALKLLEKPSLYHTEIVNVPVMNAIKLQIMLCKQEGYTVTEQFWQTLYDNLLDHMVSHKRKRAVEIKDMFANVVAFFSLDKKDNNKGLFNK